MEVYKRDAIKNIFFIMLAIFALFLVYSILYEVIFKFIISILGATILEETSRIVSFILGTIIIVFCLKLYYRKHPMKIMIDDNKVIIFGLLEKNYYDFNTEIHIEYLSKNPLVYYKVYKIKFIEDDINGYYISSSDFKNVDEIIKVLKTNFKVI